MRPLALTNPYAPPQVESPETGAPRVKLRVAFAATNFCIASFFAAVCVVGFVTPETPGMLFGAIVCMVPFTVYACAEWSVLYYSHRGNERSLAYLNVAAAAFLTFGIVMNIGEVLLDDGALDGRFLVLFTLIGVSIVAYLTACGWCRLRWTRMK